MSKWFEIFFKKIPFFRTFNKISRDTIPLNNSKLSMKLCYSFLYPLTYKLACTF
jgi:hypothetical protein